MIALLSIMGLVALWLLLGIGMAREDESIIKIRLGKPYGKADSGLFWVPYGFAWVRRYSTKVVEIVVALRDAEGKVARDAQGRALPAGGFITAGAEIDVAGEKRVVGPVNLGVTLSFRFNWPSNYDELVQCVKLLPPPTDTEALTDLFHEIILDEVRSVGSKMNYVSILGERKLFAQKIRDAIVDGDASSLLEKTGLKPSTQVVIDHINVPQETLDAIDDEEAERLKAQGVRRKAEGEKDRLRLEDEGRAAGIKALKAEGPEAMQYESLRTLREMAQGQSTTMFFPFEGLEKLFQRLGVTKQRRST
jgi:regulator of protease activity HflC (stomatin/prohibitin superfamily)